MTTGVTHKVLTFVHAGDDNRKVADTLTDILREFRSSNQMPLLMTDQDDNGNVVISVGVGDSQETEKRIRNLLTQYGWEDKAIRTTSRSEDEDWRGLAPDIAQNLGASGLQARGSGERGRPSGQNR